MIQPLEHFLLTGQKSKIFLRQSENEEVMKAQGARVHCEDVKLLVEFSSRFVEKAEEEKAIRRQQERLLQLYHAFYCVSPLHQCDDKEYGMSCGEMKKLWVHFGSCVMMKKCCTKSCSSSRFILSHFKRCTDVYCCVCCYVRTRIYAVKEGIIYLK